MSAEHPAVARVRARAAALVGPGTERAIATDTETFARSTGKPPAVLVAIANRREAIVLAIDASEYDGLALAKLAGFQVAEAREPTAYERASQARLTRGA